MTTNRSDRFGSDDGGDFLLTKPQCKKCRHVNPGFKTCSAYLAGIPTEIYTNAFDHTKPYPGDSGIRFEPKA